MVHSLDKTQVSKLPIGIRNSRGGEVGDRQGGLESAERGEVYKRSTRRQRAIAQSVGKLLQKSDHKELKEALTKGKPLTDDTNKMSTNDMGYLIAVSLIFDGMAFLVCLLDFVIPLFGTILERITVFPLATLSLYIASRNRGVNFSSKILVRFWGSRIIGFIPYLSLLPEYTLGTALVILSVQAEEKTGLKKIVDSHPEIMKYLQRYLK